MTSEARDEAVPGVPETRGRPDQDRRGDDRRSPDRGGDGGTEARGVEAAEPQLSAGTNARLTEEVRDVVGRDSVEVPGGRPRPSRGEGVPRRGFVAYLGTQRPMLLGTLAGALVIGAIIALATGSWWVLLLAVAVHALATIAVTAIVFRMTATSEHPSPELAASLSEQGIRNPDEHFTRLVDEFTPEGGAGHRTPGRDEAE